MTFNDVCSARWSLMLLRVCWMNRSTSASPPRITSFSLFWLTVPVDSVYASLTLRNATPGRVASSLYAYALPSISMKGMRSRMGLVCTNVSSTPRARVSLESFADSASVSAMMAPFD